MICKVKNENNEDICKFSEIMSGYRGNTYFLKNNVKVFYFLCDM